MIQPHSPTHTHTKTRIFSFRALPKPNATAQDLGGTNFRVMHVRLGAGRGQVESCQVREVALPREVYEGSGAQLFDFLAATLKDFIAQHSAAGADKAVQVRPGAWGRGAGGGGPGVGGGGHGGGWGCFYRSQ